jgi:arylsulfatase A-like enzyme
VTFPERSVVWAFIMIPALISCSLAPLPSTTDQSSVAKRPNILLIVADDLGYSDLGIYGGEINTPNIDRLARNGLMFTNFYAAGACSPTRAMLMSGVDHHRAGVGNMIEHIAPNQIGQPGYEGHLNDRVDTIAERLRDTGYRTLMAGKWHLGMTRETSPAERGFDRSFALLNGGAGHFDQTGLNGLTHPAPYREDGEMVDLPETFTYSTDFYTRQIIRYIDEGRDTKAPFFAYLAYTAPHWPLQAPAEDIAKYSGKYDSGWNAVREARLARMKAKGLLPNEAEALPIFSEHEAWEEMAPRARAIEARRMEVYAAMVDRLDQQIGALIQHLEETGELENTVIIFMSDNGAEGAPLDKAPMFKAWIDRFDNSYESMGSKDSYIFYAERWAQVGMTPLRLYKGMSSDGGIKVPAFITYGGFKNQGARYDGPVSVLDLAPTILAIAGAETADAHSPDRDTFPLQGQSMFSLLTNRSDYVRTDKQGIGIELFNKMGYRRGKWKATHLHEPFGPGHWQLYDITADPGETQDLSKQYPDVLNELVSDWERYAEENGVIIGNEPPQR